MNNLIQMKDKRKTRVRVDLFNMEINKVHELSRIMHDAGKSLSEIAEIIDLIDPDEFDQALLDQKNKRIS